MKNFKAALAYIACIATTLCIIFLGPQKEFTIIDTQASLLRGAQDFLGEDSEFTIRPDTFFTIQVGKQLVCILQDRNDTALMGAVVFQKGRNGHYRAINAECGDGTPVRSIATRSLLNDPMSRTVLYATNLPQDAKYMEVLNYSMFNPSGEFNKKYVTTVEIKESPFVYVHSKSGFRDFRLLDAQGNVLPDTQTTKENPRDMTMTVLMGDLPLFAAILALQLILLIPMFLLKESFTEKSGSTTDDVNSNS